MVTVDFSKNTLKREVNRLREFSQDFKNADPIPIDIVLRKVEFFFRKKSYAFNKVLNIFISFSDRYSNIYLSQKTIAEYAGLSRGHVNRVIKDLESHGLLLSNYRHMTTKLYKLSSFFNLYEIRSRLRHIFSSIRTSFLRNVTQLALGIRNINIITDSTKKGAAFYVRAACNVGRVIDKLKEYTKVSGMLYKIPDSLPISKAIDSITYLELTRWEKTKLSVFPDVAINYASEQARNAYKIRNRFNWFFAVCSQYCRENRIPKVSATSFEDYSVYEARTQAQRNPKKRSACLKKTKREFFEDRKKNERREEDTECSSRRYRGTYREMIEVPLNSKEMAREFANRERILNDEEHVAKCIKTGAPILPYFSGTKHVYLDEYVCEVEMSTL